MNMKDFDLRRRRLFQAVGLGAASVAGVSTLGACKADPGIQDKGAFHGAYPYEAPPDGHFNTAGMPYALVPRVFLEGPYQEIMSLTAAYQYWDSGEWEYLLAESHKLDKEKNILSVTLRKGLKWSDGEPLTSKDLETTMWANWLRNNPMWSSIKEIEATDELNFEVRLKNPSAVIERWVLRSIMMPSHSASKKEDGKTFGDYAADAAKIFGDGKDTKSKEFSELSEAFGKFRPDKLITSGPFTMDDVSDTKIVMKKSKNGFAADKVKFDKIEVFNGEVPQAEPLVEDKSIDYATHGFSPSQEKKFKQSGARIVRPPNYSGPGLFINFKKCPEFKDVRVRRAIAHLLNREDIGKIALAESGKAVKYMTGFSDIHVPEWLSKKDQDKLDRYERDPDKAEKLLEEAGWKKKGDSWVTPDGKAAEYEIKWPGDYADWSGTGDGVTEELNSFGFKLTKNPIDEEQYLQEIDTGEFEMAINQWGSSTHPHPHFAFVSDLLLHNTPIAKNQGGDGIAFDLKVDSKIAGKVDLEKLTNEAGEGLDEKEQAKKITQLALVFNELLPIIPIFERYANSPVFEGDGARVKEFPPDDDPIYKNSTYADNPIILSILTGKIVPNE